MAETNIHGFTVQEKLNKMDVDHISVSPTVITGTSSADLLLIDTVAIPNAVAVTNGRAILQSISVVCNDHTNTDSIKLVFTSDSTVNASITHTEAKSILGYLTINKGQTVPITAVSSFGSVENIGMVLKGASNKSVYFYAITGGIDGYAADDLTFNFGIMDD